MEGPTLNICVLDEVKVLERTPVRARLRKPQRAYFQPEFIFTMPKESKWAPARSRAPSVIIDFGLMEATDF